jgi:glycosyltransferase involved in cell wall biosynthesis
VDDDRLIPRSPPRSVHVVAAIADKDGGPAYSVPALVRALARRDGGSTLRVVAGAADVERGAGACAIVSHRRSRGPLGSVLRHSPGLWRALQSDGAAGAILHAHGIWLMPNLYPAWAKRRSNGAAKLVHSPRGMLGREALRISAGIKRPFWALAQRAALREADCLHATSASEYEEIRAAGLSNPVAVIANGVDLPRVMDAPRDQSPERIVLSLGRIHPKKGLDRLVRAWAAIEVDLPTSRLRIVGPAELGHDDELRALAAACNARRITIEPPIYRAREKLACYRGADVFVLPTLNENFAMTVAEALAAGVPVIATKGAPWAGLEDYRCGWWIDHGVDPLAAALREALAMPREDLHRMGARGRAWMGEAFGWDWIAAEMSAVYLWLKSGGEPPPSVRME